MGIVIIVFNFSNRIITAYFPIKDAKYAITLYILFFIGRVNSLIKSRSYKYSKTGYLFSIVIPLKVSFSKISNLVIFILVLTEC